MATGKYALNNIFNRTKGYENSMHSIVLALKDNTWIFEYDIHKYLGGQKWRWWKYIRIWAEVYLCLVVWCTSCLFLAYVPTKRQLTCIIFCTIVIGRVFNSAITDTFHFRKLVGWWVWLHRGAVEYQRPFFQFTLGNNNETTAWSNIYSLAL